MQPAEIARDDLFRLFIESVSDYAMFLLDPEGRIRTWNEGAQRIKGYTAAEIIGKHFSIFYPPAEIRRGKPEYELRVAIDEGRYEEEGWRIRKDGSRFWANVVITAVRDAQANLVGFAKVTRNLTERKQAEEERRALFELERAARANAEAALERLGAIQSITEIALAHFSLDTLLENLVGRVRDILEVDTVLALLLDQDAAKLSLLAAAGFDYALPEVQIRLGSGLIGRAASERRALVVEDTRQSEGLDSVVTSVGLRSLLATPLVVEGRVIGVLQVGTLSPRHFNEGDISFLQIVADRVALAIEHARLFEEAQRARIEAEEAGFAVTLRDDFLSTAAHELKTPVTGLLGLSDWLVRSAARGSDLNAERTSRALILIHRQAINLSRLVTQLLEMSRLDGAQLRLDRSEENLTAIVRRAAEQAQTQTDRHEVQLIASAEVIASVDAVRFEQVITNLLDNAIKYSPEGGLVEVELTQPNPGVARITVRDRGIGIPTGQHGRIFDRFFQAHAASHRSGLGLGLYLSREIVKEHGGTIAIESPADGGSRFIVEIPTAGPEER